MASLTDFLETALVEHVLLNTSYTSPATVYLALFTTSTTDAAGGTEVSGGSYAREAVTFTAGTAGVAASDTDVTFTMPACTVTHAALFDASTAGNMLMHAPLSAPKTLLAGADLVFPAGDIDAIFA